MNFNYTQNPQLYSFNKNVLTALSFVVVGLALGVARKFLSKIFFNVGRGGLGKEISLKICNHTNIKIGI